MTSLAMRHTRSDLASRVDRLLAASSDLAVEDEHGRVVRASHAGSSWTYTYDERGDLLAIDGPHGLTQYTYDTARRLVGVTHPDTGHTRYVYDAADRLVTIEDRGRVRAIEHDARGRITRISHGAQLQWTYRYDAEGRVVEAAAPRVRTRHEYDDVGRVVEIEQTVGASSLSVHLEHDRAGRVCEISVEGGPTLRYRWDEKGRPAGAAYDDTEVATFQYEGARRAASVELANGVTESTQSDPVDGRPVARVVRIGARRLLSRRYAYDDGARVTDDGRLTYRYDKCGRLADARSDLGEGWAYRYDSSGALAQAYGPGPERLLLEHDKGVLSTVRMDGDARSGRSVTHDPWGRITGLSWAGEEWAWRYDAAGQLVQARRNQSVGAALTYDHKGRLVEWRHGDTTERYVYGAGDELIAVADGAGRIIRVPVRTPLGVHAEVIRSDHGWIARYLHHDDRGTLLLVTGEAGEVVARYDYEPFGLPLGPPTDPSAPAPCFRGRPFVHSTGCYQFGARWYHPGLHSFLTPDTWTGAPDDDRLVHPVFPGCRQPLARAESLERWLRSPRSLLRYAYCGNDPVGGLDPTGHWTFGGTVLSLLGAIWTLPNTAFGLAVELSCLVGEVVRWLAWAVTLGKVSWETPGFDVAASERLNAFAVVFRGGWLGSFPSLLGITFGNVFFVYGRWDDDPELSGPGDILPRAYGGKVRLPKAQALYEHELRHTNQYSWLGPFFHLGLPLFGVYEWDVILHGYRDAWTERDAREHSEGPDAPGAKPGPVAGGRLAVENLADAWVYWRVGTDTQVLRCGPDGALTRSTARGASHASDYVDPFTSSVGSVAKIGASTGSRPLPATLLDIPGFLVSRTVREGAGGRPTIDVTPGSVALDSPAELTFWPVLRDLPSADYSHVGLAQGAALWTQPNAPGQLTVAEGAAAPDPGDARPRERFLRVLGRVDAASTAVHVRLYNAAGNTIDLAAADPDDPPVNEVTAALSAATAASGQRSFEATLRPADPASAFGPVQLAVIEETPAGTKIDAFTVQLCGFQVSLVDDPAPTQPGTAPGEADEVIVVDFGASPRGTLADLSGQTRARRMVQYRIANERRPLPSGGTPVLRPRMPLWTGEAQLVGVTRGDLEDLLRRRADRRGAARSVTGPQTTRISFHWQLRLTWDGPDAAAATFGPPFPRPNQRHAHSLDLPAQPAVATAVLSYDGSGRLTDPAGNAVPMDPAGVLPHALDPPPVARVFPVSNRRAPAVRVAQPRRWGRAATDVSLPALVIEFQPSVETAAGIEAVRGGDGVLQISELSFDGTPVARGSSVDSGAGPGVVDPGSAAAALPPFRIVGQNPPAQDVEDVVRALVREYVDRHAGDAHVRPLTRDCWETTVLKILRHESGGRYRQFDDRGAARRSWSRQGTTWVFGTEQSMPLFGPPHGYGIGQLDLFSTPQRGANDDEVWNWVENLRAAVLVVLAEKAASAWALIGQHAPTPIDRFTRAAFQRETVRRYNGGTEFSWTGAVWGIEPSLRWANAAQPNLGPHANLLYPNAVLGGTPVVYYTSATGTPNRPDGANTVFAYPPPVAFTAANFTPETGP
jgi:YD repeat-containing protein